MEKLTPYELFDGDEIGLLWRKNAELDSLEVLFGLRISFFDEKNAPPVPKDEIMKTDPPVPVIEKKASVIIVIHNITMQKEYTPERKTRNTAEQGASEQLSFAEMNNELTAIEGRRGVDRAMKVYFI